MAIQCNSLRLPQSGSCSLHNGAKKHLKDTKRCTGELSRESSTGRWETNHPARIHLRKASSSLCCPSPGVGTSLGRAVLPPSQRGERLPLAHRSGVIRGAVPKPDPILPVPRHTQIDGINPLDRLVPRAATAESNMLMRPWWASVNQRGSLSYRPCWRKVPCNNK